MMLPFNHPPAIIRSVYYFFFWFKMNLDLSRVSEVFKQKTQ